MSTDPECGECQHRRSRHNSATADGCQWGACSCRRFHGAFEKAMKLTTAAYRERLLPVADGAMCWEASLAAFGITVPHDDSFRRPAWVTGKLEENDWLVVRKLMSQLIPDAKDGDAVTLAVLLPHLAVSSWLLVTPGHVIAVRDGDITDTVGQHSTVKRRVRLVYEVKPKGVKAPMPCGCLEPLVFGHAPGHR
jgi:hypothetical protein